MLSSVLKLKSLNCYLLQVSKLSASAPELPTEQPLVDPSEMQDGSSDIHDPSSPPVGHTGFTTAVQDRIYPTLPTDMSCTVEEDSGGEEERGEMASDPASHQRKKVTIVASPSTVVGPSSSAAEIGLVETSSSSLSANTGAFVTAAEAPENIEMQHGMAELKAPTSSSSSSPTVPVNYAIQHISESKKLVGTKSEKISRDSDQHHPNPVPQSPVGESPQGTSQLGQKRKVVGPSSSPTAVKRSRLPLTQDTGGGILGQQPPLLPQPTSHGHPLLSSTPPQQSPSWIPQLFKRKRTPK